MAKDFDTPRRFKSMNHNHDEIGSGPICAVCIRGKDVTVRHVPKLKLKDAAPATRFMELEHNLSAREKTIGSGHPVRLVVQHNQIYNGIGIAKYVTIAAT
jgi:hypothetical protein